MPRIAAGDVTLHVHERGAGPPLLLVHGFPLDHTMWQAQLEGFADTYRVIAPDLRGFGQSDVVRGTATMAQLADDLALLLDALDVHQPVALCGLSMGGYVAWQFWLRHAARLSRLVVCDTRAAADSVEAARGRLESADKVLAEGTAELADTMLGKLFAAETRDSQPELIEATRRVMRAAPPEGVAAAQRGMAEREDFRTRLADVDVPTLVLCGAQDTISPPAEMREIAAAIPRARFVEVTAAGHLAPLENPAAVNEALREFLAS